MLYRLALSLILLTMCSASAAETSQLSQAAKLLLDAEVAHFRSDLRGEEQTLLRVITEQATDDERAQALLRLANLSWRIYLDYPKAEGYLRQAAALSSKQSETALEWARMETRRCDFQAARLRAVKAIEQAGNDVENRRARVAFATTLLEEIFEAALDVEQPDLSVLESKRPSLEEAFSILEPLIQSDPGILDASRAQVLIALLLGNGPAALDAWKSYFHLWNPAKAGPLLSSVVTQLECLLPTWKGRDASSAERQSLVSALALSRFYQEAAVLAYDTAIRHHEVPLPDSILDIARYGRFCRRMETYHREQYRKQTIGPALSVNQLYDPLWAECAAFWKTLSWTGEPPDFAYIEFLRDMDKRFGAEFMLTSNGLTWGHRVKEENTTVEQYGHRASFRYALVDSFVSTNPRSFLWDTRWGVGGWAIAAPTDNKPVVAQVRPSSVTSALSSWDLATNQTVRNKEIGEIERYSAEEDAKYRENSFAVPVVAHRRIKLHGLDALLTELRGKGLTGRALRIAFLEEISRAWYASGILAHEGRHSIDRNLGLELDPSESEFRAKLSEIVFAPRVFLALAPILNPSVTLNQSLDGHRKANERLLDAIVDWMGRHRAEIKDLEQTRPLMPQLNRLTEDQIRELFKELDPLAAGCPMPRPIQ